MPSNRINGAGLATMVAGFVLLYAGVTGRSMLRTIQDLIQGKQPSGTDYPISGQTSGATGTTDVGNPLTGFPSGGSRSAAENQGLAKLMAGSIHPDWVVGQQWQDWLSLWNRESGWSNEADTRKTGAGGDNMSSTVFAYGVAQARPYSKMAKPGWPPDKGGSSDAVVQIQWGMAYIAGRYGSPSAAWQHEQSNGWY